jgi:AmmeMemoRadiSam system protein A
MNPYVKLAKDTVETYLKSGKIISPPDNLPKEMLTKKAGVFVSIHKKEKRGLPRRHALATRGRRPREQVSVLRGCIGTFMPTQKSIAHEIIKNALSAAFNDPRFPPVTQKELPNLEFSVDILSKPKLVPSTYPLKPKKYGLIVSTSDGRRGLLLPDIPSVKTPEDQVQICRHKAGIGPDEKISLETFTVKRHRETQK